MKKKYYICVALGERAWELDWLQDYFESEEGGTTRPAI